MTRTSEIKLKHSKIAILIASLLISGTSYGSTQFSNSIIKEPYVNNEGIEIRGDEQSLIIDASKITISGAASAIEYGVYGRYYKSGYVSLNSDEDINISGGSFGIRTGGTIAGKISSNKGNITITGGTSVNVQGVSDAVSNIEISALNGKVTLDGVQHALLADNPSASVTINAREAEFKNSFDHENYNGLAVLSSYYGALITVNADVLNIDSHPSQNLAIISSNKGKDDKGEIKYGSVVVNAKTANITGALHSTDAGSMTLDIINSGEIKSAENLGRVIYSYGTGSEISLSANNFTINGNIESQSDGYIYISLGRQSTINGATLIEDQIDEQTNKIDLRLAESSVWNVRQDSKLSILTLSNSCVDLSSPFIEDTKNSIVFAPVTLTTRELTAENGLFQVRTILDETSIKNNLIGTDRIIITEKAQGNLVANFQFILPNDGILSTKNPDFLNTWIVSQGAESDLYIHNFKGKNAFSGNGMISVWALSFVPDDQTLDENTVQTYVNNNHGVGPGKWYLVYADRDLDSLYPSHNPEVDQDENRPSKPGPDTDRPNQPPVDDPAEIQQILDLGVSTMQAMGFASELDDLRARTGEVRHGLSDGAWVRASYQKERIFGEHSRTFKQETQDLHIGLDHLISASNESAWLLGGALRYAKSDQKGVGQFTNEGELEQYSAKLYATYLHDAGSYADFVIQAGRYDQELEGVANDGYSKFSADYKTHGYGLSAEVGHQFTLVNNPKSQFNPFIEPQMQLSYFMAKGKDFTTSTGMKISQGDADFLTSRLGVVFGNTFKYGEAANPSTFQISFTGGMKYEFLGDQSVRFTGVEGLSKTRKADDIDGARFYYGFASDWKVTDSLRAFAKLEREEGHHYTKDFDVSVGVRYQF